MNHATNGRVHIVIPYVERGQVRYTPTMREVFTRLGFRFDGHPTGWKPEVWAEGWKHEPDVLTRAERRALGFKP